MSKKGGKYLIRFGMWLVAATFILPLFTSCNKNAETVTAISSTQLMVFNLSPDALPAYVYINNRVLSASNTANGTIYRYPTSSTDLSNNQYFYISSIGYPLQFRSTGGTQSTLAISDTTHLTGTNARYSLYLVGVMADTVKTIFTVDTSAVPTVGKGKVRFVNASPHSGLLDVYANGSKIFDGFKFMQTSKFIEMPAGNYNIKIYNHGDQSTILAEVNPVTVTDGRLYSLCSYGIIGRTDSAKFSAALITNK